MKTVSTLFTLLSISHIAISSADEYELYLLAGQSNMDGRGKVEKLAVEQRKPSENAIIFYQQPKYECDQWEKLQPGFSIPPRHKTGVPSSTFGPEIGFTATIQKKLPDQGECYLKFIRTINEATEKLTQNGHTFKLRALLWHQGESDSKSSAERHRERLTKLIARIREDTETPNLPVILGEVYDNGNRDNVRTAIQLIAKDDAFCGLVVSELEKNK